MAEVDPEAVEAVYEHWIKRRAGCSRPLLQRLWFEFPYPQLEAVRRARPAVPVAAADPGTSSAAAEDEPESSSRLPFVGQDEDAVLPRSRRELPPEEVAWTLAVMR